MGGGQPPEDAGRLLRRGHRRRRPVQLGQPEPAVPCEARARSGRYAAGFACASRPKISTASSVAVNAASSYRPTASVRGRTCAGPDARSEQSTAGSARTKRAEDAHGLFRRAQRLGPPAVRPAGHRDASTPMPGRVQSRVGACQPAEDTHRLLGRGQCLDPAVQLRQPDTEDASTPMPGRAGAPDRYAPTGAGCRPPPGSGRMPPPAAPAPPAGHPGGSAARPGWAAARSAVRVWPGAAGRLRESR